MQRIAIIFIICLGFFLRFWQLPANPPSLSHDEVAIGYNAYSILKTGKDEYGNRFPLLFRSFDDYKLPGLVYSMVPSIAVFGLNELGVRFPIAFFGSFSVIIVYLLSIEIAKRLSLTTHYSLLTTLLFSLSPWHINFSRQAFESTGALFFLLLGILFLLKSFPEKFAVLNNIKSVDLFISSFFFALSVYFYYSVRIMIPVIGITTLIIFSKKLRYSNILWKLMISGMIFVFALLPFLPSLTSQGGFARIGMVSVVNDAEYLGKVDRYAARTAENPSVWNKFIYNRRLALADTVIHNYMKNISFQHLTLTGLGEYGLITRLELIFLIIGLCSLLKITSSLKWLIIIWFFSYPLIGAFTVGQPNSLRTLPGAPVISILSAMGILVSYDWLTKKKLGKIKNMSIIGILGMLGLFCFIRIYALYFDLTPRFNSINFADGHKQMVAYVNSVENEYDEIYISGQHWRPYIFLLFWGKVDPVLYQNNGTKNAFGSYIFGRGPWDPVGGLFMGDNSFNPEKNTYNPLKKQLYILSKNDYDNYENIFEVKKIIDGRYAKNVFYISELIPPKLN